MSWKRLSEVGIGADPPPWRPFTQSVYGAGFPRKYTRFRKRRRTYNSSSGGWQAWEAWSDFEFISPGCWFIGGYASNDTSGPIEYREEYEMEVVAVSAPWAITWTNTATPIGGGSTSDSEHYLLITAGATYTVAFEASADTSLSLTNFMLMVPAP